ncbi:hypothetical protein O1M63_06060 [Streptomyces mirabilis]|nr:hypothetical protein [Streptomyces mirabilis]
MSAEHDALRLTLGGYVLGTLPSADMKQVRVRLAACAECQAEHVQLAGLPALLATVTETQAEASGQTVPTADRDLTDRLVARAAESAQGSCPNGPPRPRCRRRQRGVLRGCSSRLRPGAASPGVSQLAGAAVSLMLIAAAAGGTWLAAAGSVGSQAKPPGPTTWRTFSGSDPTTGVSASVKVSPSAWGSLLQISAREAPAGITCRLQAVGPGGARADGATWRAGEYPPGTTIPGAVDMAPGAIEHFEILAGNGQKLVTIRA